jgi:hypothetical protein
VDPLVHQHAKGAEADLAGVVELFDGEVDGQIQVAVVEDQQRRLAAEFERKGRCPARR